MRNVFGTSVLAVLILGSRFAQAQLSLSTAVELAEKNSPRVRMAQADLDHARASRGSAKDAFIPGIVASGGYGRSTGAPLGVPVIFQLSAQSLLFNFSQFDYIHAAEFGVQASQHALAEARIEVAEDTTNTYLALDNALRRRQALQQASDLTGRLISVVQQRLDAGVDTRMELTKTKITGTQIRLQLLVLKDEIATNTQHLSSLTGIGTTTLTTDPASVPNFAPLPQDPGASPGTRMSEGIAAAYAIATSKQFTAKADKHYLFLPQFSLQANYSRVDTGLSSYLAYYPRFDGVGNIKNSQNALGFGASITVPLLDFAHRSHARETAADAAHALADAHQQENVFLEGRARLQNSAQELNSRAELARLNQEYAQEQLDAIRVQLQPAAGALGGAQMTPKDELNAELEERLKFIDVLNAELALQQTRINLLRQQGGLNDFIHQAIVSIPNATPSEPTGQPADTGVSPSGATTVIPPSGVNGGSLPGPSTIPPTAPPQPGSGPRP